MATVRFYSEFKSMAGVEYAISIDDTGWVGSPIDFTVGENGFQLQYDGENEDIFNPFLTSNVEFDFIVESSNSTYVDSLLTAFLTAQEGRFKLRIDREGVLYWTGFVLTDLVERQDVSTPYALRIRATDGVGMLKTIDYNNAGTAYNGWATYKEHLANIFSKLDFDYFHGAADEFFVHNVSWIESNHAYTTSLDILENTRVNHEAFFDIDTKGNYKYKSCYDVLAEFAGGFGARLLYSNAKFRFYQVTEYDVPTFKEWRYDNTFTLLTSSTSVAYSKSITQVADAAVMSGRVWSYYPPLQKVTNKYTHKSMDNLLSGIPTYSNGYQVETSVGTVEIPVSASIKFTALLRITTTWVNNVQPDIRFLFRLYLKTGAHWLQRNININGTSAVTEGMYFSQTSEYYDILTDHVFIGNNITEFPQVSTVDIPITFEKSMSDNGDVALNFNFELVDIRNGNLAVVTTTPNVQYSYVLIDPYLELLQSGSSEDQDNEQTYEIEETGNTNTAVLEVESFIGDGPYAGSKSRLQIFNGTIWVNSGAWAVDDTGTTRLFQELRIYEILRTQNKAVPRMNADIIASDYYPHYRILQNSVYYLFAGGTFSANADVWSGTWFRISPTTSPTTTTTTTAGITPGTIAPSQIQPGSVSSSDTPRFNFNGVITGTAVTTTSNPILTGGNDQIPISTPIEGGLIDAGTLIFLVSSVDGSMQQLAATSAVSPDDTFINIEPTNFDTIFPEGSYIVVAPNQYGATTGSNTETYSGYTDWWEVHESAEITDPDYPLLVEDIEISSDDNTGDGSTAGIKINTSGIAGYSNSSATPVTFIDSATGVATTYGQRLASNAIFRPASGYGSISTFSEYERFGAAWVHLLSGGSNTAIHIKISATRPPSGNGRMIFVFQGSLIDEIFDCRLQLNYSSSTESVTFSGDKAAVLAAAAYTSASGDNKLVVKLTVSSGVMEKGVFRLDLIRGYSDAIDSSSLPTISAITINTGTNI